MIIYQNPEEFTNGSMSLLIIASMGVYTLFSRGNSLWVIGWNCQFYDGKNVTWDNGTYFEGDLQEALDLLREKAA